MILSLYSFSDTGIHKYIVTDDSKAGAERQHGIPQVDFLKNK
jgi:hypothetical protein